MNEPVRIAPHPERVRLRVEDFELLENNGAFSDYVKAELIDGDVYVMNAQFARHGLAKARLLFLLMKWIEAAESDLDAYCEVSLRLADDSMPEPDIFLAPKQGFGPVPVKSVALIVEVSDSTLDADLGRKLQLYAAAGIPEYWVVDVIGSRVLINAAPVGDGYGKRREMPFGGTLVAATIEGLQGETTKLIS